VPEDTRTTFVLVGHCFADRLAIKSAIKRAVPEAAVANAAGEKDLGRHAGPGAVLLVNRVLGGGFGGDTGIELIRRLTAADDAPIALLVSDYPDAQAEAVAAGARPGFGKAQLHEQRTAELLREAAGA
jgi:hypothetical protein